MVLQHLENRLSLSSLNANEPMHEFQIVHALITQCRKQATQDENVRNNNDSENQPLERNKTPERRKNSSSFVSTISRTINALTQATNQSLCAKQSSHPVSIASTVKNIISQFSNRQSCHETLSLASPCESTPARNISSQREAHLRKRSPHTKARKSVNIVTPLQQQSGTVSVSGQPSTSKGVVLECTTVKNTPQKDFVTPLRLTNTNPVATKPKLRSVRARNALRLTRHESAPIPSPDNNQTAFRKTSVSVRRSKSDAICSYTKQTRRNIESNVQTKVLHFENCCKGKGKASMCMECRKHNLEQDIATPPRANPALPKIDSAKSIQENYGGALSYHRPSTISQSHNSGEITPSLIACLPEIVAHKTSPRATTARAKAVACFGGTFFGSTIPSRSCENSHKTNVIECESRNEDKKSSVNEETVMQDSCSSINLSNEKQCSQSKRKHSFSDDETMQTKRESRDDGEGNAIAASTCSSNSNIEMEQSEKTIELENLLPNEGLSEMVVELPLNSSDHTSISISNGQCSLSVSENGNLYSALCNCDEPRVPAFPNLEFDFPSQQSNTRDSSKINDDHNLSENSDFSDNIDSSSSSGESSVSPRQDYLSRNCEKDIRRTPSTRYQRMRRRLMKLITRTKSSSETPKPVVIAHSQTDLEIQYLESIRIPTPSFMLKNNSFSVTRRQLAMHFDKNQDYTSHLPDNVLSQIFSYLDTQTLSNLKCVCKDFQFLIDSHDIRAIDSQWVKDKRYIEDPCRFCRKRFTAGDVSMCRYHAKAYHCDLPYGRSYWMCCFQVERTAPGCRTGTHNNHWCPAPQPSK